MSDEKQLVQDELVKQESARRTRRSFVVGAAAAATGYGVYRWIDRSPGDQLLPRPLRKGLNLNEALTRDVFDERAMAPTYSMDKAKELRTNGIYGLKEELVPESYRLQVVGVAEEKKFPQYVPDVTTWEYRYAEKKQEGPSDNHDTKVAPKAETKMPPAFEAAFAELKAKQGDKRPRGQEEAGESDNTLDAGTAGLLLTLAEATNFPKHELVTEFKCIEGWSEIVHWGGVRLTDFIEAYPPEKNADGSTPKYVYMETPDGDYYCGFDMKVCRHPQSLLVTEMGGKPLNQWHGAPLRLHMPVKYGYKQIKRIGLIAYTDMRPDDYWTKLGYDWYAGL